MMLNPQLSFEPTAVEDVESVVERLNINFGKLVRPSTKLYWSRVTKERILEIAGKTLGEEWVKAHKNAKKSELADLMGQAFARDGKPPADVDKAARLLALAWTMPGFTAFDNSDKMATATGGTTNGSMETNSHGDGDENAGGRRQHGPAGGRKAGRSGKVRGAAGRQHRTAGVPELTAPAALT